jgi:hypothetical protein
MTEIAPVNMTGLGEMPAGGRLAVPGCAAALIRAGVLMELDAEAHIVAAAMGGDDSGYDYTRRRGSDFTPVELDCGVCGGRAALNKYGSLGAGSCVVTGSCERSWVDMHPEDYRDADGKPVASVFPCGGNECDALIRLVGENGESLLGDSETPPCAQLLGECAVDREGRVYQEVGRFRLDSMPLTDPDAGFEPYDGEVFEPEPE